MEKIEVSTRLTVDGTLIPLDFSLGEMTIPIIDIGRQWESKDGRHMLVMDASQNTYHLFFDFAGLSWKLIRDLKGPPSMV